jgi:hypothetical protein
VDARLSQLSWRERRIAAAVDGVYRGHGGARVAAHAVLAACVGSVLGPPAAARWSSSTLVLSAISLVPAGSTRPEGRQ